MPLIDNLVFLQLRLVSRRHSIMRYLGWAFAILFVLLAPNLLWLGTSTLRIQNVSNSPVDSIAYLVCETIHPVGTLAPQQSIFRFLPACGDDTLEIVIGEAKFCQTYVEGELYHVDAEIAGVDTVRCTYDDLLSSLFVTKALW
jgi:hypothetical protein